MAQFLAKVDQSGPNGCWLWTARRDAKGYGRAKFKGQNYAAHRFAYEQLVGPIPDGLEIDHLCRNKPCVNPAHLEAVSPKENMRRRKQAMTHCRKGHEFTEENTTYHSVTGSRVCRECQRTAAREWARKQRALNRKRRPHLDAETVRAVRRRYDAGDVSFQRVADEFGISLTSAWHIATRRQWKHVAD